MSEKQGNQRHPHRKTVIVDNFSYDDDFAPAKNLLKDYVLYHFNVERSSIEYFDRLSSLLLVHI